MARRRQSNSGDSLELLLDTITNTFGGILFLAILVVIMLRSTSESKTETLETPRTDLAELTQQLTNLQNNRSELQSQVDARELSEKLSDPELVELVRELEARRGVRDELAKERTELLAVVSETQTKSNEIVAELAELDGKLKQSEVEREAAERELNEQKAKRRVTSPFPRERGATKTEYAFVVRYDRLYEPRVRDALGMRGEPNTEDFVVHGEEDGYLAMSPKPYRGIPLLNGEDLSQAAANKLSSISSDRYYVCLAIWDDSFAGFQAVRSFLVANGYEYRLIVLNEEGAMAEGNVPNPKVQ
ncbi:MAG: hypothetical protein WD851_20610 [Pirellulales bacterium]